MSFNLAAMLRESAHSRPDKVAVILDQFRLLGHLTAKVLEGAKPADLPIERPSKFELVLNMRTGRTLGLSIATGLLIRADEIIE